jgi:ABC-2 type transport system permease protein
VSAVDGPASAAADGRLAALGWWVDLYLTEMKIAIAEQFQYRVANYFYMIGMIAEPIVYLVVWSTVATQQGGSVAGIDPGEFAAYYIVWTLVRNMNIVFTPYGWEGRIREGNFSALLLRPVHPIHWDLGYFAGWKVVVIVLWLPLAALLSLLFHPTAHITPLGVAVFLVAIWGAYLIRSLNLSSLGMASFWTTRVGPLFDIYFTAELLLSGRLVPPQLLPDWARTLAAVLPFQWTFAFPIEALIGDLSPQALLGGLAMQALWIGVGALFLRRAFAVAVRRYSAVGG